VKQKKNGEVCKQSYSYISSSNSGTSTQRRHLEEVHDIILEKCNTKASNASVPSEQRSITEYKKYNREMNRQENIEIVKNLIITDLRPFKIVEDTGFRAVMERNNRKLTLTSATNASKMVTLIYNEVHLSLKNEIHAFLKKSPNNKISLTGDLWKSLGNDDYLELSVAGLMRNGISTLEFCQ
jgi:hypothetical protein